MPFAITLRLDTVGAAAIEDIWRRLAAEHIDSDCHELGYAPHITLTIHGDDTPVGVLLTAVTELARGWRPLPVTLSGIGIFPGPASILWAAPVVTRDLLAIHASLAAALPGVPVHPHYRPEAWMPHVTLTGALTDPASALSAVLPRWQPVAATLVRADLVRFRPVEVLRSETLT